MSTAVEIFSVFGSIGLNSNKLMQGLDAAAQATEDFAQDFKGNISGIISSWNTATRTIGYISDIIIKVDGIVTGVSDKIIASTFSTIKTISSAVSDIDNTVMGVVSNVDEAVAQSLGMLASTSVEFLKSSIDEGMSFDAAMGQVGATLLKTRDDFDSTKVSIDGFNGSLRELAQKLGAETKFTATQVAQGFNYMALAGYDAQTSAEMVGNVLNLAAAGAMDLATASDQVTDAQTALGISIENMPEMIDQMAKAASSSNTSVLQLGDALLAIGATGRMIKKNGSTDYNELITALGVLANNGIKASEGGNDLRRILTRLTSPTQDATKWFDRFGFSMYDSKGEMKDFSDNIIELGQSLNQLTDQERTQAVTDIFGQYALAGANALLNTSAEQWEQLSEKIRDSKNAAKEMAEIQLQTLPGQLTLLESAVSGIKINVFDKLANITKDFVKILSESLTNVSESIKTGQYYSAFQGVGVAISDMITLATKQALLSKNSIEQIIRGFVDALSNVGNTLVESGSKLIPFIVEEILYFATLIIQNLSEFLSNNSNVKKITDTISTVIELVSEFLNNEKDDIYNILSVIVDVAISFLDEIFLLKRDFVYGILWQKIKDIINQVSENLPQWLESEQLEDFVDTIGSFITEIFDVINQNATILPKIVNFAIDILNKVVAGVADFLSDEKNYKDIIGAVNQLFNALDNFFEENEDELLLILTKIYDIGLGFAEKIFVLRREPTTRLIKRFWSETFWPAMKDGFKEGVGSATFDAGAATIGAAGAIFQKITSFFGIESPSKKMKWVGEMLVEGLWNGISDKISWIVEKISGFGESILTAIQDFFGISSPSKLFEKEVGVFCADGIGVGFEKEMPNVIKKMQNVLPKPFDIQTSYVNKPAELNKFAAVGGINLTITSFYNNTDNDVRQIANELWREIERRGRVNS